MAEDPEAAFDSFAAAAQRGSVQAFTELARCYQEGYGVERCVMRANEWLRRAASEGTVQSAESADLPAVAGIQPSRRRVVAAPLGTARKLALQVTAATKVPYSYKEWLGFRPKPTAQPAVDESIQRRFERAAIDGNANDQFAHAEWLRYKATGSAQELSTQAFDWYARAALQGHIGAQRSVAECFRFGLGTTRDERKAFDAYLELAYANDAESQYIVAMFYQSGVTVARSEDEAIRWLSRASAQGHVAAERLLAKRGLLIYTGGTTDTVGGYDAQTIDEVRAQRVQLQLRMFGTCGACGGMASDELYNLQPIKSSRPSLAANNTLISTRATALENAPHAADQTAAWLLAKKLRSISPMRLDPVNSPSCNDTSLIKHPLLLSESTLALKSEVTRCRPNTAYPRVRVVRDVGLEG